MSTMSLPQTIYRVVVVEDNENDRDLLVRQLKKSQIDSHVKFLEDGKEGRGWGREERRKGGRCEIAVAHAVFA